MPVRRATPWDLEAFLSLARAMHAEACQRALPLSEAKLAGLFRSACARPGETLIAFATGPGGGVEGMVGGFLGAPYFSEARLAFDLFLYVRPAARGGLAAARLWRALRDWAAEGGAAELSMGVSTGISPDRADRFYTGLGMQRMGGIYRLALAAPGAGASPAMGARTS